MSKPDAKPVDWLVVAPAARSVGGQDKLVAAWVNHLIGKGLRVVLVTHLCDAELAANLGTDLKRVPRPLHSNFLGESLLDFAGRIWSASLRRRFPNLRSLVTGGCCGLSDVNWVHFVHHANHLPKPKNWLKRLKLNIFTGSARRREARYLPRAACLVANSLQTARFMQSELALPVEHIAVAPPGADPRFFPAADAAEQAAHRRTFGLGDAPVLLFVGGLGEDHRKGFDVLFAACLRLKAEAGTLPFSVAVAGSGPSLNDWQQRARAAGVQAQMYFLGQVSDTPQLMRAADALVSPARYESFGMNIMEALCSGLPVIASEQAGAASLIPSAWAAMQIPPNPSPEQLASALRYWLAHAVALRAQARTHAAEVARYTDADMCARIYAAAEASAPMRPSAYAAE